MAAWDSQCLLQETLCELCPCLMIARELGRCRTTIHNSPHLKNALHAFVFLAFLTLLPLLTMLHVLFRLITIS